MKIKTRTWCTDTKQWLESSCHYCGSENFNASDCDGYETDLYTGFNDKHGKEIYESDILKHTHRFGIFIEDVRWSDEIEDGQGQLYCGFNVDKECVKDAEVIGNIYESKHLLRMEEK